MWPSFLYSSCCRLTSLDESGRNERGMTTVNRGPHVDMKFGTVLVSLAESGGGRRTVVCFCAGRTGRRSGQVPRTLAFLAARRRRRRWGGTEEGRGEVSLSISRMCDTLSNLRRVWMPGNIGWVMQSNEWCVITKHESAEQVLYVPGSEHGSVTWATYVFLPPSLPPSCCIMVLNEWMEALTMRALASAIAMMVHE